MFRTKTSVALLSVGSNSMLVLAKIAVGWHTGSVSVISEAAHSAIDLLAALIAFLAVRASARPADRSHPYGHGKVENLSGAVEALLIFCAAGWIIYESISKLFVGVHLEALDLGMAVMLASVAINILVSRQILRVARETNSIALEADARHLTTDILTSAGVFAGLLAVQITNVKALDPLVALGVAVIILRTAYDLTRRSLADLVDASLPIEEQGRIVAILRAHHGDVVEFHSLRSRKVGGQRHVDLHLVVDGKKSVERAHRLCTLLEEDIRRVLPDTDVVIHLEPPSEARGNGLESEVEELLGPAASWPNLVEHESEEESRGNQ